MAERVLSAQDLQDILLGAAVLGTGGGGEIAEGQDLIDTALAAGKTFTLVALADVPDEAVICTPYLLGALSDETPSQNPDLAGLPLATEGPLLMAYDRFQRHLGVSFHGVVPCELGGSNTAAAFFCAAMRGHVIVDADPSGRAVPEIQHTTYYLAGLTPGDLVMANPFGESFFYENVPDDRRAEQVARALSVASGNTIAAIDHALPMRTLRNALIPGTITLSLGLGQKLRQANATGADPAQVIAKAANGSVLFRGTVTQATWRTEGGFTLGEIEVSDQGRVLRITYKNENMATWLDGAVVATIPDLICVIDLQTCLPVTNPNATPGATVAVVVLPAPSPFTTPAGLDLFGPAYAGVEGPFRPVR